MKLVFIWPESAPRGFFAYPSKKALLVSILSNSVEEKAQRVVVAAAAVAVVVVVAVVAVVAVVLVVWWLVVGGNWLKHQFNGVESVLVCEAFDCHSGKRLLHECPVIILLLIIDK
jgi:uncharacterized membrane protein